MCLAGVLTGCAPADPLVPSTSHDRLEMLRLAHSAQGDALRQRYPYASIPDPAVTLVDDAAWSASVAGCMTSRGMPVGVPLAGAPPADVDPATYEIVRYRCTTAFVAVGALSSVEGPYELQQRWFGDVGVVVPCLRAHGAHPADPPPFADALLDARRGRPWSPYASAAPGDRDEAERLESACPRPGS